MAKRMKVSSTWDPEKLFPNGCDEETEDASFTAWMRDFATQCEKDGYNGSIQLSLDARGKAFLKRAT